MALERPLALLLLLITALMVVTFLQTDFSSARDGRTEREALEARRKTGAAPTPRDGKVGAQVQPATEPPRTRPYYDMVVAILVHGPGTVAGDAELARAKRAFGRYNSTVSSGTTKWGVMGPSKAWTVRYVFVVANATTKIGPVPEEGKLVGELYHVNVREGFQHISDKTLALMGLSQHFDFRFLAKTDSDTYTCMRRLTSLLDAVPEAQQPRAYAGLLQRCGTVFKEGHRLHDAPFVEVTGGVLKCHPMYHQGAFYVLGRELVDYLYAGRHDLQVFFNEDAMVGLWLLGVKKHLIDVGGSFNCWCHRQPAPKRDELPLPFYHNCKYADELQTCETRLGMC